MKTRFPKSHTFTSIDEFPVKMLHSQFTKRYEILGATDIVIFMNQFDRNHWVIDNVRIFFTEEIFKNLEITLKSIIGESIETNKISAKNSTEIKFNNTVIILVSGKRYSGKDFFSNTIKKLIELEGDLVCEITHFADEFKRMFCNHAKLDYERMLTDRDYKEIYRDEMTAYYHKISKENVTFCKPLANRIKKEVMMGFTKKKIFIIADLRNSIEIECFKSLRREVSLIKILLIRVHITDEVRAQRGWVLSKIDSDPTETNLDDWDDWDFRFDNCKNGNEWCEKYIGTQLKPFVRVLCDQTKK